MAEEEGITVKKSENFSEWYSQVVQKAELADLRYYVKGFLVHMPWSVMVMNKIADFFEEELRKRGHKPFLFPSVIPESFLEKEREHAEFSAECFWITEGGAEHEKLEERLALRPTSETAFYTMFSLWIKSWRDLPFKTYQRCQVWRYESYTRPFIRGREFYWIEAHDAFATKEDALNQVKEDMEITKKVLFEKLCIPFLFFKRPEHDKFKGAVHTFAADTLMPDGKVLQLPSTHFLGQNFSKAFDVKFKDRDGEEKYVWQTCYGPAFWRIFGALIAINGDDKGLVLPPEVAPLHMIIIPIYYSEEERVKVLEKCEKLREMLSKDFRVDFDSRQEKTPGWKFNYWELKGVPLRIEVGPRDVEGGKVVIARRDTGEKVEVKDEEIVEKVKELLDDIQRKLRDKAVEFFNSHIKTANTFEELKKLLAEGNIVKVNWCGSKECADYIKAETRGGAIRGTRFDEEEEVFGKCVYCGKDAKEVVYIAKSY